MSANPVDVKRRAYWSPTALGSDAAGGVVPAGADLSRLRARRVEGFGVATPREAHALVEHGSMAGKVVLVR